jgi:L-fuconolactonase
MSATRIDAHQHFWRIDRGDYGWLRAADHPKIARDFLPADLEPLLKSAGIDRTVLVQAAPTEEETLFLLDLADASPFVAGVVGWVDFDAPDAPSRIARLSARPKLLGLRPMIHDMADDEWMLRPELGRSFEAMQRGDLCFDALIRPRHLPALTEFLDRYPGLAVVVDHGAKPDIAQDGIDLWATYMRHVARNSAAFCKLSGLATEAGPNWSAAALKPYVDILLASFGPSRLMWGSDWPVLNEAGDYATWLAVAEELTQHLSQEDRDAIFGGTAAEFYRLN